MTKLIYQKADYAALTAPPDAREQKKTKQGDAMTRSIAALVLILIFQTACVADQTSYLADGSPAHLLVTFL